MVSALVGCHSRSKMRVSGSLICFLLVCSSCAAAASNVKNSREPVEVATQSIHPNSVSCDVHSMSSTADPRGTVCTCVLLIRSAITLWPLDVNSQRASISPTAEFPPSGTVSTCQYVPAVHLKAPHPQQWDEENKSRPRSTPDVKGRTQPRWAVNPRRWSAWKRRPLPHNLPPICCWLTKECPCIDGIDSRTSGPKDKI
jgi:hypothetical protein